jgi:DNA-binding CsgD family transcriptional regulator
MPFERARTELLLGSSRRRAGLAVQAREPLQAALGSFARLGAVPWARRAERELVATGMRLAGRSSPRASSALSPQEFQVASFVAQGLTNREVAAALFLSPKTVETHLGRAYRKLSVRSRSELARLFASGGATGI